MVGIYTRFLLGWSIFRGYISFRECTNLGEYFGTFSKHRRSKSKIWFSSFLWPKKIRHGIGDLTAPPLGDGVSWSETGPEELVRIFVDS